MIKTADFAELAVQFIVVALGALAGSTFMWMVLGPIVAKRGMAKFSADAWDISEEDAKDPKSLMKAITKVQAETFASSVYGALGNVVQNASTGDLAAIVEKGANNPALLQTLASGVQNGNGLPVGQLLNMFGGGGENGGKANPFANLVQMILAMQMMAQLGGGGGNSPIYSALGGGGGGGFSPGIGR